MSRARTTALCLGVGLAALCAELRVGPLALGGAAHAIVGRPATPVSYAGAARRTARRTTRVVVATSAATATAVAVTSATTAAARAAAPPPAPAPAALPVGTIVSALPAGCVTRVIGGVSYFDCGGVYYRAAFPSNNLVYVVQQP
jgi:hypothetical protein